MRQRRQKTHLLTREPVGSLGVVEEGNLAVICLVGDRVGDGGVILFPQLCVSVIPNCCREKAVYRGFRWYRESNQQRYGLLVWLDFVAQHLRR